jgi:hypothetical protein
LPHIRLFLSQGSSNSSKIACQTTKIETYSFEYDNDLPENPLMMLYIAASFAMKRISHFTYIHIGFSSDDKKRHLLVRPDVQFLS